MYSYFLKVKRKVKIDLKPKAFSLLEISFVLLIVGILIAGVTVGTVVFNKARLSIANTSTESSPVSSISGLNFWVESTIDGGFLEKDDRVQVWYDRGGGKSVKNDAVQGTFLNQPSYTGSFGGINSLPALSFDGTNSYLNVDGSFLNGSNYTVFVVDKRGSGKSDNYFIGDSSVTTSNQQLILGYSDNGTVVHSQSGLNSYTASVSGYVGDKSESRIFSFTHDSTVGKKIYVNGVLAGSSSNTNNLSNISTLKVGNGYQGNLGEVIIFARALKKEERQSVESYLSKKWGVKIYQNTSCSGVVSSQGCSTCGVSVVGISATSVDLGTTTIDCATGYSGAVTFTCDASGVLTSGSCSCASGYTLVSGACQSNCSVTGVVGVNDTTVLASASPGSTSCNQFNFAGTMSYTCVNGVFTPTSTCACASGYALSGSSCNAIECTFSGTTGIVDTTTKVGYSATNQTIACNASGYSGNVTYTCTATGAPSVVSNSCSAPCNPHWTVIASSGEVGLGLASDTMSSGYYTCDINHIGKYVGNGDVMSSPTAGINARGWSSCFCSPLSSCGSCGYYSAAAGGGTAYRCDC